MSGVSPPEVRSGQTELKNAVKSLSGRERGANRAGRAVIGPGRLWTCGDQLAGRRGLPTLQVSGIFDLVSAADDRIPT
jgi:hypothetical protein